MNVSGHKAAVVAESVSVRQEHALSEAEKTLSAQGSNGFLV